MVAMIGICLMIIASVIYILILEDIEAQARKERWERFFQDDSINQQKARKQILELVTNRCLK